MMNLHQDRGFTMPSVFVAPCASVVGDVRIIDHSCVWYGAVVRGRFVVKTCFIVCLCACVFSCDLERGLGKGCNSSV